MEFSDNIILFKVHNFLFSFPSAEKKQNAAAAPDAIKISTMAW